MDLGAHWLHGEKENPVYQWLRDLDLIGAPEEEELEFAGLFRTKFGEQPPRAVVFRILELLMDAKQSLYKFGKL